MSSEEWADFGLAIVKAQKLINRQRDRSWQVDEVEKKSMDCVMAELKFLYIFVGYTQIWSDASSSSSSSSHHTDNMEPLFIKVAATAKKLTRYLQHAFIDRFTDEPQKFTTKMVNWWRSSWHPFASKASELRHVFTLLNQKIALLKPEIMAAYQSSMSAQSIHPRPPSRETCSSAWDFFYSFLQSELQYLSEEKSDPLRMQLKALEQSLNSLYELLTSGYYGWSHLKENVMAHFGGMVVHVAHLCCLCWYNAPVDQRAEEDMATLLSVLHNKMGPATPEFLDIILGFLEHSGENHWESSIYSLLFSILDITSITDVLYKELVPLLTCLIKISKMHDMMDLHSILVVGIKDVLMEAIYLKDKTGAAKKTHFAIVFAKIWSVKTEIFIKTHGTLFKPSKKVHLHILSVWYTTIKPSFFNEKSVEYQIWKLIEGVHKQVQSLYQSSRAEDYLEHIHVSNLLFKSVVQIKLLKAKELLLELLEMDASMMLPLQHKIGTLHEGLFLLIPVVDKTKEIKEDEKLILTDIEIVATGVISFCNTFSIDSLTEGGVKNMDVWLLDLLEKVQHLKEKLKGLYLQIPKLNLPKIPRLCFIELLLQNLRDLLNRKHDLVAYTKHAIEAICSDLEFTVSAFGDVFEQGFEKQECKDIHTRLVDAAYQVEYVIDLMMLGNDAMRLHHLSDEIKHIKLQISDLHRSNTYDHGVHNIPQRLTPFVSQVNTTSIEKAMVGFNDHKEKIIGRLTRGTLQRDIVSITGMPGIGKTTLANNVFCSPSVMYHFPIRAWCCVSHNYKKRDLLLDILSHIITITDGTQSMSDADLDSLLYKKLKRKRYLIIMDDMWSARAWDDLQLSFPDDSNGSRILLTSRLQDVVSKISDPYPLHPLSEEESWELLKIKIFQEKDCPNELLEVGQQIARNCKGLPLAIGAIAGLLDKTKMNQVSWKQIAESVSSHIVSDPETRCKEILELSYKHLPDHLKACFLYFGAFPEDKDIPVRKLLWLWIAEGFVRKLESKCIEDLAEDYLMDLIGRSLVIVAKTRSNGKVKACRVHDVVRDFSLLKAKDDNFLQLISTNDEPYSSFAGLDYDVHYEHFDPSNYLTYEEYRLCFCVNRENFVASEPSGPFVRSLLYIATTDMYPRCPYDVAFISNKFKCLRVLDLESINMGVIFANGIDLLVYLRYLAVCGDMEFIPQSLSKLQNLETLVVKGLKRKVMLPDTIWTMKKLMHVHVTNRAIFTLQHAGDESSSKLDSLVSLSFPCFICGKLTDDTIMRFPNLRKLRCIALEPREVSVNSYQFPTLESLHKLESLKISYYGKVLNTSELNFPSSVKKLTLSNFRLPWSHISAIGRLHNLEVLKLISRAFEGPSWDMAEGKFVNLKYLKLDTLNIIHWDASSDHLPQLQQLIVRNCEQLEEIPFDFVTISTLTKIEVQQCGISVEESVRRIDDEGIEGLEIVINNSHSA